MHFILPNLDRTTYNAFTKLHQTKLELERQDSKSAHWRSLYDEFKEEGEDQDQINHYASLVRYFRCFPILKQAKWHYL